jgi:iron complex transport system substrate-binding protein
MFLEIEAGPGAPPLRVLGGAAAVVLGLALISGGRPASASGLTLQDDLQRAVAFARYPQRIVTLLPSLTETVCALGACDRLVATDRYSNWPAQVTALPKTGGLDDAEVEAIIGLKPDLVLISRSQRITDRLSELGVASFALNTESFASIGHTVTTVGEILGLSSRAAALNRQITAAVEELSAEALARRRGAGPTVYFEVDRAPYAAGAASFIGELLARLGARNIVPEDLGPFPKLNPEFIVRENPDVIFVSRADAPHLADRPGWDRIRAVREQRLCYFSPAVRDTIERPGPRVAEGMRALLDCLARVAP